MALLAQRNVCLCIAGDGDLLGNGFHALMPGCDRVTAVRDIFNLVISCAVGLSEVRRRRDDNEAGHLRMYVAYHRYDSGIVEFEGTRLPLRPGAEVMRELLITANVSPDQVVR